MILEQLQKNKYLERNHALTDLCRDVCLNIYRHIYAALVPPSLPGTSPPEEEKVPLQPTEEDDYDHRGNHNLKQHPNHRLWNMLYSLSPRSWVQLTELASAVTQWGLVKLTRCYLWEYKHRDQESSSQYRRSSPNLTNHRTKTSPNPNVHQEIPCTVTNM